MVKHVILWKLKDECNTPAVKAEIKESIEGLLGVVPGLREIQVQVECFNSANADVMLYSVLDSREALDAYAVHPAHVEVANTHVRPYVQARACMDFEVE